MAASECDDFRLKIYNIHFSNILPYDPYNQYNYKNNAVTNKMFSSIYFLLISQFKGKNYNGTFSSVSWSCHPERCGVCA